MKKKKKILSSIGCALLLSIASPIPVWGYTESFSIQQDERSVTCLVMDNKEPVIGANVLVKGTTIGGITDINGRVTLATIDPNAVLVVSYMGYTTQEVPVNGKNSLTIVLTEDSQFLDEVVVVGYGTQKKVNLTGAVEQIGKEVLEGRPTSSAAQMLMGAVPNLNITLSDGKPNRAANVNVRGTTSIGQGGSALVLIDGVEGSLDMLNPNDIESVSVLKDAAAASIYGARAPYGVVLVTTKNPTKNKTKIHYSTNLTLQQPTAVPEIVTDGYTWADHFYKAYYGFQRSNPSGINKTQSFSLAWLEEYKRRKSIGELGTFISDGSLGIKEGDYVYFNDNLDVYGLLYKNNVFSQTHNISVSGSGEKFDYFLSGRYYNYDGLFNSDTQTDKYKKMNMRSKVGYQLYNWLKISNNTEVANDSYYNPVTYSEGNGNIWRNLQDEAHPSSPMFNPDGTMTFSGVYSLGDFLYGNSGRKTKNDLFRTTTSLNAQFLDNKLRFNADFTYRNENNYQTIKRVRSKFSRTPGIEETISGTQSYLSEQQLNTVYLGTNIYGEYENTFAEKHYIKFMLGYNYEQSQSKQLYAYNDDLLMEDVGNINLAMGTDNKTISSYWNKWRTVGSFFRLNYAFNDRYLVEFNGRYDGSSKFPSSQRWAFFPSVSAGWRVNEEAWFKVDPAKVSNLKVRASYGSLGNGNVAPYSYDEAFVINKSGRIFNGVKPSQTSIPNEIPESLTWETSQTFDVGLDLGFFHNKLTLSADYYIRWTKDMYTQGPTLPSVFGATSPKGNYADMNTKGYEISVSWDDSFELAHKPFHYYVKATLADYQSTIDKYNNSTRALGGSNAPNYYSGMKVGEIWGYVSNGLWQSQADIDAAEAGALKAGQKYYMPGIQTDKNYQLHPGDIKIEDLNGNGYIDTGAGTVDDPGDRKIIGNSEPRYIYSFTLGADWNRIYFNAFFQGVGKQDWYPGSETAVFWGQYNRPYNQMPSWHLDNYWTEDNPDAYLPRYTGYYRPFFEGNKNANTRYLQNVAYLRLKNIQIGYNLPDKWVRPLRLSAASIYFSGENLFTWSPLYKHTRDMDVTNINGSDADLSGNDGDGNNYPTMKSFSLGINITF